MSSTYTLHVTTHFNSARALRNYEGPCKNIHGHTFKVQANVSASEPDSTGLVIDFIEIKTALQKIVENFDHQYINEIKPFDIINPTNENLAKYFFEALTIILQPKKVKVTSLSVWESNESGVTYVL